MTGELACACVGCLAPAGRIHEPGAAAHGGSHVSCLSFWRQASQSRQAGVDALGRSLALVRGAPRQQEVHIDRQLLPMAVRAVLSLQQDGNLIRELYKHHAARSCEVQADACRL